MSAPEEPKTIIDREHALLERVVHEEIQKQEASVYWRGLVTPPFASEDDFDRMRMIENYAPRFPHLHPDVIRGLIDGRIYVLHLR